MCKLPPDFKSEVLTFIDELQKERESFNSKKSSRKPKVHTTMTDGRPMLPRCCACGLDVLACTELSSHRWQQQIINKARLTHWRNRMKKWNKKQRKA